MVQVQAYWCYLPGPWTGVWRSCCTCPWPWWRVGWIGPTGGSRLSPGPRRPCPSSSWSRSACSPSPPYRQPSANNLHTDLHILSDTMRRCQAPSQLAKRTSGRQQPVWISFYNWKFKKLHRENNLWFFSDRKGTINKSNTSILIICRRVRWNPGKKWDELCEAEKKEKGGKVP